MNPSRLNLTSTIPRALAFGVTLLVVWPAFSHSIEVWTLVDEFSFGFLVPPISLVLLLWRRHELVARAGRGANAGLVIVIAALLLTLVGHRVGVNAISGIAVSPLLFGVVVFLWGWSTARVAAFPLFFLTFGLALYTGLLASVGFVMQNITAVGATALGRLAGLSIARDGLTLRAEQFAFIVADECSGMNSLVSLSALAAVWVHLSRGSVSARSAVVISVVPLVMMANTARVTTVLLVASWFGQDAAIGFFHGASSLVLFGLSLVGLVAVSRVVGCRIPDFAV